MATKPKPIGTALRKAKAPWVDPDDAPPLGKAFFKRAKMMKAGAPVGRPKSANPKKAISLRVDPDVLEAYRARGAGWQADMNADLRKAAGLKPVKKA